MKEDEEEKRGQMTMTDNNVKLVFPNLGRDSQKKKKRRRNTRKRSGSQVQLYASVPIITGGREREALCVVKARGGGGRDEKKRGRSEAERKGRRATICVRAEIYTTQAG